MLQNLIGPVTSLLDKFIEDKDTKAKLAHDLATMAERHAQEVALGQIEVNKQEAQHRSIFVAGWRPFAGWVCVSSMAYHFVLLPILSVALAASDILPVTELPEFDMSSLMTVLLGMLGLGGLRSYEKKNGLTK